MRVALRQRNRDLFRTRKRTDEERANVAGVVHTTVQHLARPRVIDPDLNRRDSQC